MLVLPYELDKHDCFVRVVTKALTLRAPYKLSGLQSTGPIHWKLLHLHQRAFVPRNPPSLSSHGWWVQSLEGTIPHSYLISSLVDDRGLISCNSDNNPPTHLRPPPLPYNNLPPSSRLPPPPHPVELHSPPQLLYSILSRVYPFRTRSCLSHLIPTGTSPG